MASLSRFASLLVATLFLSGCALDRGEGLTCDMIGLPTDTLVAQDSFDPLEAARSGLLPNMVLEEDEVVPSMTDALRSSAQREIRRAPPRPAAAKPRKQPPLEIEVLSLSAGGQYGSFGAGFLHGWAENKSASRPNFDLVTGVSAGGMLAPVAFSGRGNDEAFTAFRGLNRDGVFRRRPLLTLGRSPSLFDPKPLEGLLRKLLSDGLIEDVARRHRAGARLLVMAVDLDTTRARVFDLGQMAASAIPMERRRDCMTEVMLASAAIPGVFPPRNIDGTLYVDGGLRDQIFLRSVESARAQVARETGRDVQINATIVVNGSLRAPQAKVKDNVISYAERSLFTLSDEVLRDSILETISFAQSNDNWIVRGVIADLNVEELCPFSETVGTFDSCVTTQLYDHGVSLGKSWPVDFMTAEELRALAEEF